MLQSPPSIFPDSSFRLQALMHGRNYLSPVQGTSVPHQSPAPPIDPSQFRAFICHQTPQRLPHFPLSIPPGDVLPQYHPTHAGLGQTGYSSPPGLLSAGRTHLQPSALDSYSQTLFSLSQQAHASSQGLPHPIGIATQQQVVRQTFGKGTAVTNGRDADGSALRSDRYSVLGLVGYVDPRDSRFPDKNSAQDLSLKASGAPNHRQLQSQVSSKQSSDNAPTSPFNRSQPQPQKHPPKTSGVHGADEIQRYSNGSQIRKDCFTSDKSKGKISPWKSYPVYPIGSETDFSFKVPNSVGVQHPPSDRNIHSNGFACHPSNSSASFSSLSPSGARSPASSSATAAAGNGVSSSRSPFSYRRHFSKGSVIQLASGQLKRVEELRTEDFLDSCGVRADLNVDISRVTHIRLNHDNEMAVIGFAVGKKQIQVTVEAAVDHPFFVFHRGWSSCSPSKTFASYSLPCLQLAVGDTCVSLTNRYPNSPGPSSTNRLAVDEFLSPLKTRRSSRGSPIQSPEPHEAAEETSERRCDDKETRPESNLGQSSGQMVSRKKRWSAPDKGSTDGIPAKSPTMGSIPLGIINHNTQSPNALFDDS